MCAIKRVARPTQFSTQCVLNVNPTNNPPTESEGFSFSALPLLVVWQAHFRGIVIVDGGVPFVRGRIALPA